MVGALVGGAVVTVLTRHAGWTAPLVVANLGANLVLASVAVLLSASDTFVNSAFVDAINTTRERRKTLRIQDG